MREAAAEREAAVMREAAAKRVAAEQEGEEDAWPLHKGFIEYTSTRRRVPARTRDSQDRLHPA